MKYFNERLFILCLFILFTACKNNSREIPEVVADPVNLDSVPPLPALFSEGFISTRLYERDMAIAPDGSEFMYTLGNYNQTQRCLVVVKKENNSWGKKNIVSFSGTYNDIEPFYAPDGKQLFFASNRPLDSLSERRDYNIWVSQKHEDTWSRPKPLSKVINTEGDEFYPSVSKNGTLYFTATRSDGIGREDIFVSRYENGVYQNPVPLDEKINSSTFEFNAYISPGEDLLVFSSFGREDGLGGGDLYYSVKDSVGNWMTAQNMGTTINSEKLDFCPFIDFNSGNFYFTSNRQRTDVVKIDSVSQLESLSNSVLNGMGNIYRVDINTLGILQ